jgi:hypothetical protein
VKYHTAAGSGRIKTHIERLTVDIRKGVVKNRVQIGEIHGGSDLNRQYVRLELLVMLHHANHAGMTIRWLAILRRQPHGYSCISRYAVHTGDLDVPGDHSSDDRPGKDDQKTDSKKGMPG